MKHSLLTIVAVLICGICNAQSREQLFENFCNATADKDSTALKVIIEDWQRLYPNDAEIYSLRANLAFMYAYQSLVALETELPHNVGQYFTVKDKDDTTKIAGYMFSKIVLDEEKINQTIDILTEGISKFPDRMDLRKGKISILVEAKMWDALAADVIDVIRHSSVNKNRWRTSLDQKVQDGYYDMFETVQSNFGILVDYDELELAEEIVDAALKYYPKDPVFLSDKAAFHYFRGDLESALKLYKKASKADPSDMLIKQNIEILEYQLKQ